MESNSFTTNPAVSPATDRKQQRCLRCEQLKTAILRLPAVRNEIEANARNIYVGALSPDGRALDHWLAAEREALAWIDAALVCTSVPARVSADVT